MSFISGANKRLPSTLLLNFKNYTPDKQDADRDMVFVSVYTKNGKQGGNVHNCAKMSTRDVELARTNCGIEFSGDSD